ncbi:sequestosome-1-like [Dicentrarchus labrax]|uniref:sequestosome-1-like n=1 Tax=Dicentrarchus labrax TaxID=13489 RepID=UPI0021F5E572|nr:sequestosome-1-like [Dicentrarchus labrax]
MPVQVHARLLGKNESVKEVRKFDVSQSFFHRNFAYFHTKIAEAFHLRKRFKLYYKDNDEMVVFSSDNELATALTTVQDNVFNVYIKVSEQSKSKPKPNNV